MRDPSDPVWQGLDADTLRFLEVHEARAASFAGRTLRDLGDAHLLYSPLDPEPFHNRLVAVRWPAEPGAFDHRLTEAIVLFGGLDRRPHLWVTPGWSEPPDIVDRLAGHGFEDLGAGYFMRFTGAPEPAELDPPGIRLEHWHLPYGRDLERISRRLGEVLAAAFGLERARQAGLRIEIAAAFGSPAFHVVVAVEHRRAVATGQRFTFDGASYLSSIGTLPEYRRRGLGRLITATLVRESVREGARHVYLGVHAANRSAIRLYEAIGFAALGPAGADMLLA